MKAPRNEHALCTLSKHRPKTLSVSRSLYVVCIAMKS